MNEDLRAKIESAVVTAIVMLLLFLLTWYVYIDAPVPEEEEGIEVSFGDSDTGGGVQDGLLAASTQPTPTTAPPVPSTPSDNDLMTQEDESAAALRLEQEKKRKQKEKALEEERRKKKEQEAREKAEREAKEKALAEERAKKQAAVDKAKQMGALFGNTDSPEGGNGSDRESASSATKGNPVGHGSSGGNTWSLNGRGLRGELPKPSQDFKQEGTVKVAITVDKEGNVVAAKAIGGTVSDEITKQMAVKAALKAKFTDADRPDKQMGTITYTFKYK